MTLEADGPVRATYAEVAERVDRLGRVLERLGVKPGERVATFAWNSQRHFELYLAVPSYGAVLHTLNIRLFPEQVVYIVNHAEDGVVFVDGSLVAPLAELAPQLTACASTWSWATATSTRCPGAVSYEQLLDEAGEGEYDVARDRRARRGGALLHERHDRQPEGRPVLAPLGRRCTRRRVCTADAVGLSSRDRVLAIVPMFHVNAWGLPFAAALTGAGLLLPGPLPAGRAAGALRARPSARRWSPACRPSSAALLAPRR